MTPRTGISSSTQPNDPTTMPTPYIGAHEYFPGIGRIPFEGRDSDNPLAFKHYDANRTIGGKTMAEHLRFAVCYWHSFCNAGHDPFGPGTRRYPWDAAGDAMARAEAKVDAAFEFFSKLGFSFNPQFTDKTAACMVISDDVFAMLLTEPKFKEFTPKAICDATKSTEVLVCLSQDSRDAVNDIVRKAVAGGGSTYAEAKDYGFMYQHGFQDPDGHIWEVFYMDPAYVQ